MKPSPWLCEIYFQLCEAAARGDHESFGGLFSERDGVLAIGTDPAEWWEGHESILRVVEEQMKGKSPIRVLAGEPRAWRDGSLGWVAGRPAIELSNGAKIRMRLTAVLRKEEQDWKIIQYHLSTGLSNEDLPGEAPTT